MQTVQFENRNGLGTTLNALVHFPENFDANKRYPAVVVTHPGGGVKEQTASLYASKLAQHGFIAIAHDATYQGDSSGAPRHLENPFVRSEDISAVVDYLTTLPFVDAQRIGAMGVCAGGGYSVNAAICDRRIKAVGTVSAVNIGAMFNRGWDGTLDPAAALPLLQMGSDARSVEAAGGEGPSIPFAPATREQAPNAELAEAWEYYRTPRCQHPNSPGYFPARSFNLLVTYDAYHMADVFLTQPLQIVVGSEAGSKWMSDDLHARAASKDKHLHVIAGANHMQLYDVQPHVDEASAVLVAFFREKL
ncbi:MAG: alpha/beta hydrolase [Thermomonas sp.]|uniref:alpha/beta hydrolase n=1 Tax=Thermomonas sp. TaxID=1971895 RepID=UPI0039E2A156